MHLNYVDSTTWSLVFGIAAIILFVASLLSLLTPREKARFERELNLNLYHSWSAADLISMATEHPDQRVPPTYINQYGDVCYTGVLR